MPLSRVTRLITIRKTHIFLCFFKSRHNIIHVDIDDILPFVCIRKEIANKNLDSSGHCIFCGPDHSKDCAVSQTHCSCVSARLGCRFLIRHWHNCAVCQKAWHNWLEATASAVFKRASYRSSSSPLFNFSTPSSLIAGSRSRSSLIIMEGSKSREKGKSKAVSFGKTVSKNILG
jgi:hypothetical protein